jgi:hypothetical protein
MPHRFNGEARNLCSHAALIWSAVPVSRLGRLRYGERLSGQQGVGVSMIPACQVSSMARSANIKQQVRQQAAGSPL